jgi:hypothetical protein
MRFTSSGKAITTISIDPKVRDALHKKSIHLGTACELGLKYIDALKEVNNENIKLKESIAGLQKVIQEQYKKIIELERGVSKNGKN